MTPKQLEVFRAVMSTGTTIGASVVLKLSQSAISRQLSALEADLGFNLFHRDRGRLLATAEARILVEEVDELADVLARLKRRTDELGAGRFGRSLLKMGFPHSMTTTILPRVIRDFLAETTSISLELVAGPYSYVEHAVTGRVASQRWGGSWLASCSSQRVRSYGRADRFLTCLRLSTGRRCWPAR